MKSGTKQVVAKRARSAISAQGKARSQSLGSAPTSKGSTDLQAPSDQPRTKFLTSKMESVVQYLSKSTEITFRRMIKRRTARDAYVRAEVVTSLAHQIRAIRTQRGWTQDQLAKKLKTTQAVVSRLENPAYGKYSLATLFDLSSVFDSGLEVRFVSLISMLDRTFTPSLSSRYVSAFEDESSSVEFYDDRGAENYGWHQAVTLDTVLTVTDAICMNIPSVPDTAVEMRENIQAPELDNLNLWN